MSRGKPEGYGLPEAQEFLTHPEIHEHFRSALEQFDETTVRDFNSWLHHASFDPDTGRWITTTGKKPPNVIFPFRGFSNRVIEGALPVVGTNSLLPPDIQDMLKRKFPQNFLPFEEVDYQRFLPHRWFSHPAFQEEFVAALEAYRSQGGRPLPFWEWVERFDFDPLTRQITENPRDMGTWRLLAQPFENRAMIQRWPEVVREMHDESASPYPHRFRHTVLQTFPDDFDPDRPEVPYLVLPQAERFRHPDFYADLEAMHAAYQALPRSTPRFLSDMLDHMRFERDTRQWVYDPDRRGRWRWVDMSRLVEHAALMPPRLRAELTAAYPHHFIPEQVDYLTLKTPEWISSPKFHAELQAALEEYDPALGLSLIHFIKVVRPREAVRINPDHIKTYKTDPGPWRQLASYLETHRVKRKADWREIMTSEALPQSIRDLIYEKFPTHFQDVTTAEDFRVYPCREWLRNEGFRTQFSAALTSYDPAQKLSFQHWLRTYAGLAEGAEVLMGRGPWSGLGAQLAKMRESGAHASHHFMVAEYGITEELSALLQQKFPADFHLEGVAGTVQYETLSADLWLQNKEFQTQLLAELRKYTTDTGMAFSHWLSRYAKVNSEVTETLGSEVDGPWLPFGRFLPARKGRLKQDDLQFIFTEYQLPEELVIALKEKFPRDFTPFDVKTDTRFRFLSSSETVRNVAFGNLFFEALKTHTPNGVVRTLFSFLQSYSPPEGIAQTVAWSAVGNYMQTELSRCMRAEQAVNTVREWGLQERHISLLIEKFPVEFTDFDRLNDPRYYLLPRREWIYNTGFQNVLLSQIQALSEPVSVGLIGWLRGFTYESQGIKQPWHMVAHELSRKRSELNPEDIVPVLRSVRFSDELIYAIRAKFPSDFELFQLRRVEVLPEDDTEQMQSIRKALAQTGIEIAAAPYIFRRLSSRIPEESRGQFEKQLATIMQETMQRTPQRGRKGKAEFGFLLRLSQIVTQLSTDVEGEAALSDLQRFNTYVMDRHIREHIYQLVPEGRTPTPRGVTTASRRLTADLLAQFDSSMEGVVVARIQAVNDEISEALQRTAHLDSLFTHRLSIEQRRAIDAIASSDRRHLLAHPPGEGKTAISLAGAWEYLRRQNRLKDGVVLFMGTRAATDNIIRKLPDKLGAVDHQYEIAGWNSQMSVSERFALIRDELRRPRSGPLILPMTFAMLNESTLREFNEVIGMVRKQKRSMVVIGDEYHHMLGSELVVARNGFNTNEVTILSGPNEKGNVIAVMNPRSKSLVDIAMRTVPKSVVISGTPMNTDIAQLVHIASMLRSTVHDNQVQYPSFDTVREWSRNPVALSLALHEQMSRSAHLPLPPVEHVVLSCDSTEELPASPSAKARLAQEVRMTMPALHRFIGNGSVPVIISVPYIDQSRESGAASTTAISSYLRELGVLTAESLDSRTSQSAASDIIERFQNDEGVDVITFSPAFSESRDLQGKRPMPIVISLGASTIRGFEQPIRRIVRYGNSAERVFVVVPVLNGSPMLSERHETLIRRLHTAAAILDPVSLIGTRHIHSTEDIELMMSGVFGERNEISNPAAELSQLDNTRSEGVLQRCSSESWNTNGAILDVLNAIRQNMQRLSARKRLLQRDANGEGQNYLNEMRELQNDLAAFLITDIAYLHHHTRAYPHVFDEEAVRQTAIDHAGLVFGIEKDSYLQHYVWNPVVNWLDANKLHADHLSFTNHPSERILTLLLRQRADPVLQIEAWMTIRFRYQELITMYATQNGYRDVEDVMQELWLQLQSMEYLPYGSLSALVKYAVPNIVRELLGKNSIQAAPFSEFDNPDDDRPFEDRRRFNQVFG